MPYKDKEKEREYYQKNKEKLKRYGKEYYFKNKKRIKEQKKEYLQRPEVKIKNKKYHKEYRKEYNKNNTSKINAYYKQRKKDDLSFRFVCNLRTRLNRSLKIYSTNGKVMSTNKYLDMPAIIKKLTPFPKDIENYEVDHIIPLVKFNHNDFEQIRKAWLPSNLQWLTKEENRKKSDKIL